ncbi:acyltransferase ChoActase/COT/CPT [Cytidiella melzeri]|nr:acyltransferase ChoActase/COT/CPT [Cytidiella melzeri]
MHTVLRSLSMKPFSSLSQTHATSPSQARLPRLPVPELKRTLQRYIKSLHPFLQEDEAKGGPNAKGAVALRTQWAEDFEKGLGSICQSRLQALDKASPNNWLDDNIWLKKVYHEWRAPLLVNSNWWLTFMNDPTVPAAVLSGKEENSIGNTGITSWQIRRATWLVHRLLDFRERLQRQQVYPETTKTGIWLQTSINRLFNISRLPRSGCDTFSSLPPSDSPFARSLLVSARDWFYAVEVIDSGHNPIVPRELEKRLNAVVLDVSHRISIGEAAVPISVLTTDCRDRWAENQQHLLSLSTCNRATLEAINNSLIALSLDHYTYHLSSLSGNSDSSIRLNSQEEVDAHLHNIRSSHPTHPGRNRWYDKPFTFIVESNTRAGAMGEHSIVDALAPSIMAEYAIVEGIDHAEFDTLSSGAQTGATYNAGWRRLDWVVDDHIRDECVAAEARARAIAEDSDDSVLWFNDYGAEWVQAEAKLSPDGYVQMCLQLAWYRTQGCFTATYETALTRLFHKGRTETIRTFSSESRAWVLAMDDPSTLALTRYKLLQAAVAAHSHFTRAAATGRGIDRHLLGLRCMLQPGETHEIFQDELYARSQTWKLSTSGLSAGPSFRGTGFGSPEHDGYGINYLVGPDMIKFGIESKHSCPHTSTKEFKHTVASALRDMQKLCSCAISSQL